MISRDQNCSTVKKIYFLENTSLMANTKATRMCVAFVILLLPKDGQFYTTHLIQFQS
jgi:hypothetical protein